MAAKIKIEMQTPDETDLVHTLPSIDDHPEVGKPTHAPAEVQAANAVNATKKKTLKDVAPKEDFPLHGPTNTPMAAFMNQPLGVKKAMATASEALRARGHHVLAGGVDLASKALPDSPFEVANAGLLGYGARQAMRGAGAPEGSESPDVSDSAPASGVSEAPTPPPAPKLPMPEPLPSIEDQYHAAQQDPRTPGGPGTPTGQAPIVSPSPAPPAFENKTPNRAKIDAIKKGTVAGVAGAGVAATTGTAEGSTPDYDQKEQGLMQSMSALGHPIMKVSGDRTAEQQAALFAKGPGVTQKSGVPGDESRHQLGMAGDFAFVGPDGKPDFSPDLPWDTLGRMAKIHGFEWGGDFKTLKDMGHVQLPLGAGAPGAQGIPATGAAPTGPTPGIKVEPMDAGDHKEAKSLPMWRQVMDPLMEQAPFITGATGGMLAGTAALPTAAVSGPFGPAVAAAGGAYTGGLVGDAIRQTYRHLTGQDLDQTASQRMDTMSAAGRSQMYQEMVGQGFQAYMAARALGSRAGGSLQALNTSGKYGLNLSAADMSTSSLARGASRVMNYISQTARTVTDTAREAGESNAVKAVRDALDKLTTFHSNMETGTEIQAGIKAGIKGMKEGPVGSLYQAAKKAGPDVDLRPLIADLTATFNKEGTPQSARNAILKLFPEAIDPATGEITALVGTDPYTVSFEQAAKLRTRLGLRGRKALESIGTDATSLATKLYGDLSETLGKLSPDFAKASGEYNKARQDIANRVITATMKSSPDKIVSALGGTPSVQTVDALRNTMLKHAQSSGVDTTEALTGMQGFQALRRSWFDQFILKNKAGAFDPAGMAERMAKANGALQGFFGFNKYDTEGIAAVQMAKDIATALQRRVPIPSGSAANWARAGELTGLVTTALKYGMGASAVQVGTEEVLPGFITWAMHRPTVAKMFIQGLQNQTSVKGASLMGRALGAYFASGGPDADPEPDANDPENMPPYDPNAPTPGATPGAKGTSGQVDPKIIGMGSGVGIGGDEQPQPQASTDPMTGAPINVHTYDPTAVPEAPGGGVAPYPSTPRSQIRPELQPKPRTLGAGATKISAAPMDALSPPSEEDPIKPVTQVVHAIGDKIRAQGRATAQAAGAGSPTADPTSAQLGSSIAGGAEGLAQWVEDQFTPENIAMSMVPIHELAELEQLTRSLGPSAEGFPGLYSRLTRGVEGLQANKQGMVPAKKVLDLLKNMNPDEVAWKEVVPWLHERMGPGGNVQTPVPKAELLAHLQKNKINLRVKSTGEPSDIPLSLGEKEPYGGEGENMGYSARINSGTRYIGDAKLYPVNYEGEEPRWQAMVPRSYMNQGLPHDYTVPEGATIGTYGDTATFDSKQDAENWLQARVSMGARDPEAHTPQFEKLYALPGEPPAEGKNYRETRVTMPGGTAEGQNPKLDPQSIRFTSHYPDYNIVGTTRGQDYSLPRWKVEGAPDPNAGMLPDETPEQWETRRTEMNAPVRGNIADEYQADVHEEAGNARNKILETARDAEIARRINKAHDVAQKAGRTFSGQEEKALKRTLDNALPDNLFDKPHIEIRDGDENDKVIRRFLTQDEADAWLEAEQDHFPNAKAVHVKEVDPLAGYQKISSTDPAYKALKDDATAKSVIHEKLYDEEHELRSMLGDARTAAKDRMAKELGYEDYDEIYRKTHYSSTTLEERTKARADGKTISDNLESDPGVMEAEARRKAKDIETDNARHTLQLAKNKLEGYNVRTGNFSVHDDVPVPDMPFKDEKAWAGLGMKHEILKHSAMYPEETTFIGHAGGKENADRYNLMYEFDKVRYNPEEKELEIYKNGRKIQSYDMPDPTVRELRTYMGPELADRLMEKIENYEPQTTETEDSGLPGTEREREQAEEEDRQNQWDREYEYQRNNHTVESYERPVLDDNDEPELDEDGDPITETRWRWFEDDQFDEDDPDTWHDYDSERLADRGLQRNLESLMDSWDYEPSDDVYSHLEPNSETEIDPEAHPTLEGLDLSTGGEGMLKFYDQKVKRWMESLLAEFGGEKEMRKIAVPGKKGQSYMWIMKLTPEMKAKILKTGFSLMALNFAIRDSNAPQSVKDAVSALARKDTLNKRRSLQPQ